MSRWPRKYAGNPNGTVTGDIGELLRDTATPALWQNTDGATAWALVYIGNLANAGSSAIAQVSPLWTNPPAAVTLATEGTIDWLYLPQIASAWNQASVHAKVTGGWLFHTWDTFAVSGTAATQANVAGCAFSTGAAADDMNKAPVVSAVQYGVLFSSSGAPVNFGFRCRVPMRASQQVIRLYFSLYNVTVRITGASTQSGVVASADVTAGTTQTNKMAQITFKGVPGDELIVTAVVVANPSSGSLSFAAATIGAV